MVLAAFPLVLRARISTHVFAVRPQRHDDHVALKEAEYGAIERTS